MPIAILPDIDEQRCIGCALCVEICTALGPDVLRVKPVEGWKRGKAFVLPLFHPSTGFTLRTSGPRAVQISTQSAQPMHLCSSMSGSIAIGIYNSLRGQYCSKLFKPYGYRKTLL